MKKDVFYFSHDSNAKDDPKCVLLIEQLGLEGYGIFWMLIETLREQPEYKYPINLIPALARRYNTTAEKVRAVVFSYELFKVEMDVFFYSESLNNRMQLINDKRAKARESINKRWEKYDRNTNVLPTNNERNTSKVKESKYLKENIIKEKANRFSAPSLSEVENYFITEKNINPDDAKQYASNFILFYESKNWYVGKNKMSNWKSAATRSLIWDNNTKNQKNNEKSTYIIPD